MIDAAASNFMLDVFLTSTKGHLPIRVVRTDTYIKTNGSWYFVAGQETKASSNEEYEEHMKR
jgi:hypothetical protein